MENVSINTQDFMKMLSIMQESVSKSAVPATSGDVKVSRLATYLLSKAGYDDLKMPDGTPIAKSEVDNTTLDFTRGRTLSEEQAEIAINFIYDKSAYIRMFNSRIVNKLVVPIEAKAITKKNLISNEQNGGTVSVINRRIIHNFGINLYLKHIQLQKDIPLQTVINNLYKPAWEQEVMNDIATAFANDLLLLIVNGVDGDYSSTENFYDLNNGFVNILQTADGKHTNTYGTITVVGDLGRYLTPQKVDATGCTASNYTGANLIALLRKTYNALPTEHRNNPNNVFMMAQADLDLYIESRSDIANPSNPVKEDNLTNGRTPNFMGHRLVAMPDMDSINEMHEYKTTLPGAIIFGDPKNIDVASDKSNYLKSMQFNARGSNGAVFEYTYDMYMDVQVAKPNTFAIAFKGAKVSQPVIVSEDGSKAGMGGEKSLSTSTYTISDATATTKYFACCDNENAVIVKSTDNLAGASYDTLAEALGATAAVVIPQNTSFTVGSTRHVYLRAYHPNMIASECIDCNFTVS